MRVIYKSYKACSDAVLITGNYVMLLFKTHIFKLLYPYSLMGKRGLSDVVTTLLIILLAFASVAIIWVVVKAFIFESAGQLEIGQFTNSFSIPADSVAVNNQLGLVTFNVKREAGDGNGVIK